MSNLSLVPADLRINLPSVLVALVALSIRSTLPEAEAMMLPPTSSLCSGVVAEIPTLPDVLIYKPEPAAADLISISLY